MPLRARVECIPNILAPLRVWRGTVPAFVTLAEAVAYYEENDPKGEYVLVVAGAAPKTGAVVTLEDGVAQVLALKEQGMRLKDAAKEVAEHTGLSKNELYAAALER